VATLPVSPRQKLAFGCQFRDDATVTELVMRGRKPTRKKGAYTPAERARNYRRRLKRSRPDPQTVRKQQRRAERERQTAAWIATTPNPTGKQYGVIYGDPEWRDEVYSRKTGLDRAADNHYSTSEVEVIKARKDLLQALAAKHCVLFLWTTIQHEAIAHEVLKAWGFEYRSQVIWKKPSIGMGRWVRSLHEILLIATRGNPVCPAPGEQWDSVIEAPRGKHSEKPEIFYELIESYFPHAPKIEINARRARPGWDRFGPESDSDVLSPAAALKR
jgi:N6-adenosine-specific RNA methylase IME4